MMRAPRVVSTPHRSAGSGSLPLLRRGGPRAPSAGGLRPRFRRDALGQLRPSRLAVPLLVDLGGDLPGDQKLRELPALGLALEGHGEPRPSPLPSLTQAEAQRRRPAFGAPHSAAQ